MKKSVIVVSMILMSIVGAIVPTVLMPILAEPPSPIRVTAGPLPVGNFTPIPTQAPTSTPDPLQPTLTPSPTTPALPILNGEVIGIQIDPYMEVEGFREAIYIARQMRVSWVKVQLNWGLYQPDFAGQLSEDMEVFRLNIEAAKRAGMKVLISYAKAPLWARSTNSMAGPPDNPQDFANFVTFSLNTLAPWVDAVELWNEPNLLREWNGQLSFDGAGYMRLFVPAYEAVRSYSPTMPIISAGLAPTGFSEGSVDDRVFLQQMYDNGFGNYADVYIGVHPYGWGNAPDETCCALSPERGWDDQRVFFFRNTLEDYREIAARNGDANRQFWITELGWATWDGLPGEPPQEWMVYNSREEQALYMLRALEITEGMDDVVNTIIWNLNYGTQINIDQRNEIVSYSLFIPTEIRPLFYWMRDRPTQ